MQARSILGLMAVSLLVLMGGCTPSSSGPKDSASPKPRLLIFADISESMFLKQNLPVYRSLIVELVDGFIAETDEIQIVTFLTQKTSGRLPVVYKGLPESAEEIEPIIMKSIYPDRGQKKENGRGTSFRGIFEYINSESKSSPVKVCIITDGGLTLSDKDILENPEATDEKEWRSSAAAAKKLAANKNIKKILILPVDAQFRNILREQVVKPLDEEGKVTLATRREIEQSLEKFKS